MPNERNQWISFLGNKWRNISGTRDLNELATKTDFQGDLNF